ncbi:MAG: Putative Cell division protein DivIB [bacterium 42_11]|nr:MAG: Putative Cell division protein DivIB [bacterium 42_11]
MGLNLSRKSRFIFKIVFAVSCVWTFYFFVFKSDFFKVDYCEVKGSAAVSLKSLEEAGILPIGKNIWLVNEEDLAFEIEKRWFVKVVRIVKKYPSSVIIKLEDQLPIAVIKSPNGLWLMSLRGLLWPVLDVKKLPKGLCVVKYYKEIVWVPGKEVEAFDLRELINLFSAMNGIEEIDVKENYIFVKSRDYDIFFSKGESIPMSLSKLRKVLEELSKKKRTKNLIFDMRFNDMVIVREREK